MTRNAPSSWHLKAHCLPWILPIHYDARYANRDIHPGSRLKRKLNTLIVSQRVTLPAGRDSVLPKSAVNPTAGGFQEVRSVLFAASATRRTSYETGVSEYDTTGLSAYASGGNAFAGAAGASGSSGESSQSTFRIDSAVVQAARLGHTVETTMKPDGTIEFSSNIPGVGGDPAAANAPTKEQVEIVQEPVESLQDSQRGLLALTVVSLLVFALSTTAFLTTSDAGQAIRVAWLAPRCCCGRRAPAGGVGGSWEREVSASFGADSGGAHPKSFGGVFAPA